MTPLSMWEDFSGKLVVENAFEGPTAFIFLTPTLTATVLLLIPNYVTAIIGATIYAGATGLAGYMVYIFTSTAYFYNEMGPGSVLILMVLMTATALSVIHSVKMTKNRPQRSRNKENEDLIDI